MKKQALEAHHKYQRAGEEIGIVQQEMSIFVQNTVKQHTDVVSAFLREKDINKKSLIYHAVSDIECSYHEMCKLFSSYISDLPDINCMEKQDQYQYDEVDYIEEDSDNEDEYVNDIDCLEDIISNPDSGYDGSL